MAKKVKNEVEDYVVLTDENLKNLPIGIREDVNTLTENLKPKDVMVLNPLIVAMEDLKKINEISWKEDDDQCIQQFKDAKREIGSFNTSLTSAHKKIKKPYYDVCKKIDSVKNSFKDESDKIKEGLFKRFKPHLDAEEAKKQARLAKKEAAAKAALEESQKKAKEAADLLKKTQIYNEIKYATISDFKNNSLADMNKLSKDGVASFIKDIGDYTYDKEVIESKPLIRDNHHLLDEEQVYELKDEFEKTIESLKKLFSSRLEELEKAEQANLENAKKEGSYEQQLSPNPIDNNPWGEEVKNEEAPAPATTSNPVGELSGLAHLQAKQASSFSSTGNDLNTPDRIVENLIAEFKNLKDSIDERKNNINPDTHKEHRQILVNMSGMMKRVVDYIEPKFNELKNK